MDFDKATSGTAQQMFLEVSLFLVSLLGVLIAGHISDYDLKLNYAAVHVISLSGYHSRTQH